MRSSKWAQAKLHSQFETRQFEKSQAEVTLNFSTMYTLTKVYSPKCNQS